jgi:hypothetical protein
MGLFIPNNPTIERSMININPSFFHNFFKVAIRSAIPDIKENRINKFLALDRFIGPRFPFRSSLGSVASLGDF